MRIHYLLILGLTLLMSCQSEPTSNLKSLNLLQYGVPMSILAPDSAKVETMDLVVQKDITVKSRENDDYYVQIYASDAETNDVAQIKSTQLREVKGNRYFSKIINEEEQGFIYETKLDSTNINYGFRYVYLQGDKQYVFQTGLIGTFTQEEVENMYKAVQQQ